jgi:hypothetical protein
MKLIMMGVFLILSGCASESDSPEAAKKLTGTVKTPVQSKTADVSNCTSNYDSAFIKYAEGYQPDSIEFNNSFSGDLDSFLRKTDTNCLRKQNSYEYFVSALIAKHLLYELKCCNQDYDLQQMKEGPGSIIVNEYRRLAYNNKPQEMLNTGSVIPYIEKNEKLKDNLLLNKILIQVKKQEHRIGSGAPWHK